MSTCSHAVGGDAAAGVQKGQRAAPDQYSEYWPPPNFHRKDAVRDRAHNDTEDSGRTEVMMFIHTSPVLESCTDFDMKRNQADRGTEHHSLL